VLAVGHHQGTLLLTQRDATDVRRQAGVNASTASNPSFALPDGWIRALSCGVVCGGSFACLGRPVASSPLNEADRYIDHLLVVAVDRPLKGGPGPLLVPRLLQKHAEVDRRLRRLVGVAAVDRPLIGGPDRAQGRKPPQRLAVVRQAVDVLWVRAGVVG